MIMDKEEIKNKLECIFAEIRILHLFNEKATISLNDATASKFMYMCGIISNMICNLEDQRVEYYDDLEDDEKESQQGVDSHEKAEKGS